MNPNDIEDKYEYPFYLWGTGSESYNFIPRLNDGYLYHYTSPESLFKILQNMTLKLSKISGLNDPTEGVVNWLGYNLDNFVEQFRVESEEILDRCSLISFAANFKPTRWAEVQQGTMHARMWAQYAANNTGACICIRKDRFIQENKSTLDGSFYKFQKVKYGFGKPELKFGNDEPIDFLKRYWKEIFYYKEMDWKQEDEVRFFGIGIPNDYMSLKNSIAYICLGPKFHDSVFKSKDQNNPITEWEGRNCFDILLSILQEPNNKCFKRFKNNSFAQMLYSGGYLFEHNDYSFANRL